MTRAFAIFSLCALTACSDMSEQPKQRSYAPLVGPAETPPGAVTFLYGEPTPPRLTLALVERGQQRFRIYCTPCHSELGNGQGMIVQRGFPEPPSYTSERLLKAPTRHFVDVIARGHGAMYSYAARVPPTDRWAIAAYIRALQISQNASAEDLAAAQAEAAP
ncbi:c-type cytochrome [Methylocystis sp.]|uniref:c-type cytochrome n=1 Tax=Methylocystis sp. TaxID=1911079 RepID=UPI003D0BA172